MGLKNQGKSSSATAPLKTDRSSPTTGSTAVSPFCGISNCEYRWLFEYYFGMQRFRQRAEVTPFDIKRNTLSYI